MEREESQPENTILTTSLFLAQVSSTIQKGGRVTMNGWKTSSKNDADPYGLDSNNFAWSGSELKTSLGDPDLAIGLYTKYQKRKRKSWNNDKGIWFIVYYLNVCIVLKWGF